MINGTWNGVLLGAWNPSVGAATTPTITGEPFAQALQWSSRTALNAASEPVIAGTQVNVSAWLNAAGVAGHPSDGHTWAVSIGLLFTAADGSLTWVPAVASIASGAGWTQVSGQTTVPPLAVKMSPVLQIERADGTADGYHAQAAAIAFTTSFNGWNILAMPSSPAPRQLDISMTDSVGEAPSMFTRKSQVQQWIGADWWELNVSMPPMGRRNNGAADNWIAFLAALQGKWNVFQIGNPLKAMPRGTPLTSGAGAVIDCTVTGYNAAAGSVLYTRGWKPSTMRLLLPGDHIQVGYRLHLVSGVCAVNSDANGKAAINIWPSIRELPADGQPIYVSNAKGLFRLASNVREFSESYLRVVPIAFKCKEAR